MLKKTLITIALCVAIGTSLYYGYQAFDEWDSPLGWARERFPFGRTQPYIIKKNESATTDDGKTVQEGMFYYISTLDDTEPQTFSSGRKIGKTAVDLEPFLDKQVYIYGTHYEGTPLLLKDGELTHLLEGDRHVVIDVERVELVTN